MIRGLLLACSLALATGLGIPAGAFAQEPELAHDPKLTQEPELAQEPTPSEQPTKPESPEQWRERILTAKRRLISAQKRHDAALHAYQSMRHRRYPRGEGKREIIDELDNSAEELANAQENYAKVEAAARHAGATPNWFEFKPEQLEPPADVPAAAKP
jgi:hypothetical protein